MDKNKTKNLLGPYANKTFFMNTLMKLCTYCTWKKKHLRSQRKQVLLLKLKIYYFHLSTIYQSGWCKAFLSYWKLQCYQNWAPHHVSPELREKKSFIFMNFPDFWTKSFPWLLFKFQVIQTNLWTGSIDSLNWLDSASFTRSKKNIHVFSRPGKHNSKITWHYF